MNVDVRPPFAFQQTLAFISSFPPNRDGCVLGEDHLTTAVAIGGRAYAFTLRAADRGVAVEIEGKQPAANVQRAIAAHATQWIGADDDLAPLYEASRGDAPFAAVVDELHGLHHVRFPTLADSVVYSILMQRAPMQVAAALKRKLLDKLGLAVTVGDRTLLAMPELDALAKLDEAEIIAAIEHRPKATRIAYVAREVAKLGEPFLREAPYAAARDALLAIDGVGPFAAAAILLRGLGRMNELPWMPQFERAAHELYGVPVSEATITRRYGDHIGYWSFYVMTGVGRRARATLEL